MLTHAETTHTRTIDTVKPALKQRTRTPRSVRYPNALRAWMRKGGYRFRELAEETTIAERTLYDWASGKRPIPQNARAQLAHVLGCEVEDLAPCTGPVAPAGALPVTTPRTITLGPITLTVDDPVLLAAIEARSPCYCVIIALHEAQRFAR